MSEMQTQPAAPVTPQGAGLSQWQRVVNVFTAPSKTFTDIRDHSRSWWLPFVIMVVFSYLLFAAITMKIGWAQVAENTIHMSPKSEERLAQAPPEQRELSMKWTQYAMEGIFAFSPVLVLIIVAVAALVLWGTINFVFGGKATFGSVFAVYMYAALPSLIKSILGIVVIFTGIAPESFNLSNFAPTNAGAFLNQADTNAALYKLASSIDFTTIWTIFLLGIGLATVARVKRGSGYMTSFGWWVIIVLIGVGWAAAFS
jgi:hypothetical protein